MYKRSKYKNIKTEVNGIIFDSKREAERYCELKMLQSANLIQNLQLQVRLPVEIKGQKIFTYVADFVYVKDGQRVIEDAKGFRTDVYKLKKRAVEVYYNTTIIEV